MGEGEPGEGEGRLGRQRLVDTMDGELHAATGLDLLHVPYKGSAPAVQDLIGGQVQLLIDAGSVLLPQIKAAA